MNDRELVERILLEDQGAFAELVKSNQALVTHMVARLIDNAEDREEICQDIFMQVYHRIDTFGFNSKLSTWIATIAYRKALNFLRGRKNQLEQVDLESIRFKIGGSPDQFSEQDFAKFVHRLIDQMPVNYRIVLTLYHIDGFSYPEIVEVTGMPEGTVKNYLFRARMKLKEIAKPYIGNEIML